MFERFTATARAAVVAAQSEARALGHTEIRDGHVLLGVLSEAEGVGARVLTGLGVDLAAVRAELSRRCDTGSDAEALRAIGIDLDEVRRRAEAAFGTGALERPRRQRAGLFRHRFAGAHLPFTPAAKKVLEQSLREAMALKHNYIGTEHLLLGLLAREPGEASGILRELGVTVGHRDIRNRVLDELKRVA